MMDELGRHLEPETLLRWYDGNARQLPWRENVTPYTVLISEIMLQQTRVNVAIPFYHRFLQSYPDFHSLAGVSLEQVLKSWQGLGYYNRARALHRLAQIVCEEHGGVLPETSKALLALPGIGQYTAGAIQSIAFGQRCCAVDGNVLRILYRLVGETAPVTSGSVKRKWTVQLESLLPDRAGDFNQALMDLGAGLCTPGQPDCAHCPLNRGCIACREQTAAIIPTKLPAKERQRQVFTIIVLCDADRILMRQRPHSGLLAGLWEFPGIPGHHEPLEVLRQLGLPASLAENARKLDGHTHVFTHRIWELDAWLVLLKPGFAQACSVDGMIWTCREQLRDRLPVASAYGTFLAMVLKGDLHGPAPEPRKT